MKNFKRRGILFVLSSPSGAGKSSISKYILKTDEHIHLSVSFTTRKKRNEEIFGKDYNFISKSDFQNKVNEGYFLEWAEVFGNYYGTPKDTVQKSISNGVDVLFDIDWQGTQKLSGNEGYEVVSIFILPPSRQELENRLRNRAQDTIAEVKKRMSKASDEMSHYMEYDYIIINNDLEESAAQILNILRAERLKRKRLVDLNDFVKILRAQI